jgi:hypothetical protein
MVWVGGKRRVGFFFVFVFVRVVRVRGGKVAGGDSARFSSFGGVFASAVGGTALFARQVGGGFLVGRVGVVVFFARIFFLFGGVFIFFARAWLYG